MGNMQEYGLWLALVIINAVIVSQWINYLILMSDEVAGLAAGVFLSIFLASSSEYTSLCKIVGFVEYIDFIL